MVVVTGLCYKLLNKSVKKLYGLRNNSFEIFIFCPNIQVSFSEKIVDFLGVKNSWKCCIFDFLAIDNFYFTRKIVKNI